MGQEPQVGGRFVGAGRDPGERVEHLGVDLARVRLAGYGVGLVEAHLAGHELFELAHLLVVAVEQLQKAGLGAGGALGAAGPQRGDAVLHFGEVQCQVVCPQAGPAADRGGLGRLQVREPQRGQVAILPGKVAQRPDHRRQPPRDQRERLAQQDEVGVVGHKAARGPQVDDRPGRGALVAVGIDVRHHVVPQLVLVLGGRGEVDVVDVGPQRGELLLGDRQPQLGLGLRQRDPQPPPRAVFALVAPQRGHLARRVAGDERILIFVVRHSSGSRV